MALSGAIVIPMLNEASEFNVVAFSLGTACVTLSHEAQHGRASCQVLTSAFPRLKNYLNLAWTWLAKSAQLVKQKPNGTS